MDKRRVAIHGKPLLARALSVFLDLFPEVLLVLAEHDMEWPDERVTILTDIVPRCAAVGGLYTGLRHARHPRAFVAACDMPFLDPDVIACCVNAAPDADVTLAQLERGLQPLHAVYSKACVPVLQTMIASKDLCLRHLAHRHDLSVHRLRESELAVLNPGLLSFLNVNTPGDVAAARAIPPVSRARS